MRKLLLFLLLSLTIVGLSLALGRSALAAGITLSPAYVPASHAGNIPLTVTYAAAPTAPTLTVTNSVTGTTTVAKVSQTAVDATHYTLTVTTSAGTGTATVTDGTNTAVLTVNAQVYFGSPRTASTSATTPITLTGYNSAWTVDGNTFSLSGPAAAGASLSGVVITGNGGATANLLTGAATGELDIVTADTGGVTQMAVSPPAVWQPLLSDSFARASTVSGAAGTMSGVGNGWTDLQGGVYNLSGGVLQAVPDTTGGNPFTRDLLLRPVAENTRDGQLAVTFVVPASSSATINFVDRYQNSGNFYLYTLAITGGSAYTYDNVAGSANQDIQTIQNSSMVFPTGNSVTVTFKCLGASGTVLSVSAYNNTTGAAISGGYVGVDNTSPLQAAGRLGFGIGGNAAPQTAITGLAVSYNNPSGLALSPASLLATAGSTAVGLTETGAATFTPGTPGSPTFTATAEGGATVSLGSQTVSSSSAASLTLTPGGATGGGILLRDPASGALGYLTVLASQLAASASSLTAGGGPTVVTLTGPPGAYANGTYAGTSGPLTVAASSGSGATLTQEVVTGGNTVAATIAQGPSGGTVTFTDPTTSATVVLPEFLSVAVTDPNVFFSPYATYSDGSGSLQANNVRAGSTLAQWACDGNYVKTVLTGTTLTLSVSASAGWRLLTSVDSAPWLVTTTVSGAQTIALAPHLSQGAHTVFLYADADGGGNSWTAGGLTDFCTLTGLSCDGATSAPALLAGRALVLGDSYRVGVGVGLPTATVSPLTSALMTDVPGLMRAAGCEYGTAVGLHGGYTTTTFGSVPPVDTPGNDAQTSWNKYHSGAYRTYTAGLPALGGQLSPVPTLVANFEGYNDSGGTAVQAAVADWLTTTRAASGSLCSLLGFLPQAPSSGARASVQAAFAAAGDAKAFVIDPGLVIGLGTGVASNSSFDGIHPNSATMLLEAGSAAYQMAAKLNTTTTVQSAPLTLTATAGVNSEVLTWTADSGATNGYEVDWKPSSVLPVAGQVKSIVAIVGPGTLTWTDTSAYRLAQSGRYNVVGLH